MNPAIFFHPDGYLLTGARLMGRHVAGDGFLRAAVKARGAEPLVAYTPRQGDADLFAARVRELDPEAAAVWLPAHRIGHLARIGLLYRADPGLADQAFARLRLGPAAYSMCGVTHTLSSDSAMRAITALAAAPVMPWDAVVCTSAAARSVVERLLDAQADYLAWRLGAGAAPPRPQLPVIPLGVHLEDFDFGAGDRAAARAALDLAEDEIAVLFPGRLSFSAKAHPYATYAGLEAAAGRTGARLALIHAGQFANPALEPAYRDAAGRFCPSVRCLFLDGKTPEAYAQGWRAADLFVSLADNVQETFGITPLEAMASRLPVVVSDWDGYKDTIRDGVDGFRIATRQPAPGAGESAAWNYEAKVVDYDAHLLRLSTATAVDLRQLADRLCDLIGDPQLRRRMGEAGRTRVEAEFRWESVYRRYQELWAELAGIRAAEGPGWPPGPSAAPHHPDPFALFAAYPTGEIGLATRVRAAPGAGPQRYLEITEPAYMQLWRPAPELARRLLAAAAEAPTVGDLSERLGLAPAEAMQAVGRLAKLGLLELEAEAD